MHDAFKDSELYQMVLLAQQLFLKTQPLEALFSASEGCRDYKWDIPCFKILDHASTYSQLQIKESFHIEQLKPELSKHVEHVSLSLHF